MTTHSSILAWPPRGSESRTRLSCLAQHNRGPHGGKENSQKPSRSGTSQGVQSIILLLRNIIRDYVVNIMFIYFFKTLWSKNNIAGDHHQASSNIQQEDSLEIFLIPLWKKKKKICKIEVHFVPILKFRNFKESEIIYKTKKGIFFFQAFLWGLPEGNKGYGGNELFPLL